MTLRTQKSGGNQHPWKIEELKAGFEKFYEENGRYPTATEIDNYTYLPTTRSIQRSLGGLVALREKLDLKSDYDLRSGSHSTARAFKINTRAHKLENTVYDFLIKKYGKEFVHREYFFTDDKRNRADFFIYNKGTGFCVDVFYPSDTRNLAGCINSKLKKYLNPYMRAYPVIFLQMNDQISQDRVNRLMDNKKNKLPAGQSVMCWETFEGFCRTRKANTVSGK